MKDKGVKSGIFSLGLPLLQSVTKTLTSLTEICSLSRLLPHGRSCFHLGSGEDNQAGEAEAMGVKAAGTSQVAVDDLGRLM